MTEFTDDQLCLLVNKLAPIIGETKALILTEELRPAPKFAKGQVYCNPLGGPIPYRLCEGENIPNPHLRALTLTEMGPLVQKLFGYVEDSASTMSHTYAQDLIKRFKEVHGDA